MDPVIEPEGEAVHSGLVVVRLEAGEELADHVGPTVAVGVLGVEDVRRGADQRALAPRQHAGGKRQAVEKERGTVERAVGPRAGEKLYAAAGLPVAIRTHWVVGHLDHPQFAVSAKVDRDRAGDERFGGDEFDREAGLGAEGGEGFWRRLRHRIARDNLRCAGGLQPPLGRAVCHRRRLQVAGTGAGHGRCRGWLREEIARQQLVDGADDLLLQARRELRGPVVIDHRAAAFVAALLQNTLARNVARGVVRVAMHPQARAVGLALQAQAVVHDDFAGQEDQREVCAEMPGLNEIREFGGQGFAAVETRQVLLRMMGNLLCLVCGERFPLGPRGQLVVVEGNALGAGGRCGGKLLPRAGGEAFHFVGNLAALRVGEVGRAALVGVLVRAAADGHQADCTGMIGFKRELGGSGPVAVNRVQPECHAVAGVADEDRANATVRRDHPQHREIVIHGRDRLSTAVHREAHLALRPLDAAGPAVGERGADDLLQLKGQLARVAFHARLLIGREVSHENVRRDAGDHRRGVRVRGADREAVVSESCVCEAAKQLRADGIRHAEIVHRDKDGGVFGVVADGQGLRVNALRHTFGLGLAHGETGEADRVIRRDVHARDTHNGQARGGGMADGARRQQTQCGEGEGQSVCWRPATIASATADRCGERFRTAGRGSRRIHVHKQRSGSVRGRVSLSTREACCLHPPEEAV